MHRVAEGAGAPFRQPRSKARSAGNKRRPGVFSFGYFFLDKQRKVSRLSVREPTLNWLRDSETLMMNFMVGFALLYPAYELYGIYFLVFYSADSIFIGSGN
jgi:hypothetical protein